MKAIAALLSLVLASGAQAQSLKEKYELSEPCGKRAAEVLEKRLKSEVPEEGHQIIWGQENHYNSHLNKCFFLEVREDVERGVRESKQLKLIDLDENREIGIYVFIYRQSTTDCSVQEKQCKTEDEWRALTKPFMED
jgi:hypothetical protein